MKNTPERGARPSSDVAFSPSVKEQQRRRGSREAYARMEARGGFHVAIDDDLAGFIARQRSFFLATASAEGQPYVQHRGGPPGFLHVLDERTLAFADYRGNRQFISLGNLAENPRVHLFLIDYAERARVKVWGRARVVEDDQVAVLGAGEVARFQEFVFVAGEHVAAFAQRPRDDERLAVAAGAFAHDGDVVV